MPGRSRRPGPLPGKAGARRLSEKQRWVAVLMGWGRTGVEALREAGLNPGRRATVSEITASIEGQEIIQHERKLMVGLLRRWALGATVENLAAMFPDEFELTDSRGRKRKPVVSRKEAIATILTRHMLQTAGLLGPDQVRHSGTIGHEHRGARLEELTDDELDALEGIADRLPEPKARGQAPPDPGRDPDGEGEA
jgi:hypothetical protein